MSEAQWLIVSGPDGYGTRIVTGVEALERAYLEEVFGPPIPVLDATKSLTQDLEIALAKLRDPDEWEGDKIRFSERFEDGYVEIIRLSQRNG